MKIYLDSSAFLKGFVEEPDSNIITDIVEKSESGKLPLVISVWTLSECISVLDKARQIDRISEKQMNDTIIKMIAYAFNFERKGTDYLDIVEPDGNMIYHSIAYIRWYHLSADDALHTMCAASRRVDALVLADGNFANRLKNPEKIDDPRLLAARPRIEFKVLDLNNDKDLEALGSLIQGL